MILQHATIGAMLGQSMAVLRKPRAQSLEQRGGQGEALIYVGAASTLAGVVCFALGYWFGGIGDYVYGVLGGVLFPLIGFAVASLTIFYIGRWQGGMGTLDKVFYTCSLLAPFAAIGMIALFTATVLGQLFLVLVLVALAVAVYQTYLTYLAARSSMNLAKKKAIATTVAVVVAAIIVESILDAVLAVVSTNIGTFILNASWRGF